EPTGERSTLGLLLVPSSWRQQDSFQAVARTSGSSRSVNLSGNLSLSASQALACSSSRLATSSRYWSRLSNLGTTPLSASAGGTLLACAVGSSQDPARRRPLANCCSTCAMAGVVEAGSMEASSPNSSRNSGSTSSGNGVKLAGASSDSSRR